MEFPTMEQDDLDRRLQQWQTGRLLIQEAFPDLDADQREFILTGITPQEWEDTFADDDEDIEI